MTTKKHFLLLDGLRGIAALAVVIFHFMEVIESDYSRNFIGHGFLAVDFFFCLSGFVIAYAYDDRIQKPGVGQFFRARLIRLHPLVILGSVLGLLGLLFNPFGSFPQPADMVRITGIFFCSLLLIPYPVMPERFFNLFGLNAPAWSLFWEYVANIVYAVVLSRLRRLYLWILLIPSAAAVCYTAFRAGSLLGGWSGPTFWDGLARVSYSFLAGMLVYRSGWIIKNRFGFLFLSFLLSLAFLSPYSKWNFLSEPLIVLLYFPFLIALGAGTEPGARARKICSFSGKISYPLYMTHYWVLWIFAEYFNREHPLTTRLFFVVVAGILLILTVAYLAMIAFDIPVRRRLSARVNGHQTVS